MDQAQIQKIKTMFPSQPYKTQLKIACQLYNQLTSKKNKAIIVESPTGTGKTYALLIGVLSWLEEHQYDLDDGNEDGGKEKGEKEQNGGQEDESNTIPSWLVDKGKQNKLSRIIQEQQQRMQKMKTIKQVKQLLSNPKKPKPNPKSFEWQIQDLEQGPFPSSQTRLATKRLPSKAQTLSLALSPLNNQQKSLPKLIFISRTHTQLAQVMQSIQKINQKSGNNYRFVNVASKDHLCVHGGIEKNRVFQKCQYLLSHGGCPYYHQQAISEFFGLSADQSQKLGMSHNICSYYAIKNLMPLSQILCLPYSSILCPEIRSKLAISLKNSILVFDQAHNLLEQEQSLLSPQITYRELCALCCRIEQYLEKYGGKMAQDNVRLVRHISQIARAIIGVIASQEEIKEEVENKENAKGYDETTYKTMTKIELFIKMKISEIKLHKIKNYISLSNFDQKLVHFTKQQPQKQPKTKSSQLSISTISTFLDFLTLLMTSPSTGPSSCSSSPSSTLILLKNLPSHGPPLPHSSIKLFTMQSTELPKIIKQCRLCVLAGGTMEPINSFMEIFGKWGIRSAFIKGQHVIGPGQCWVYCIGGIKCAIGKDQDQEKEKQRQIKGDNKENFYEKSKLFFTYNQLKNRSKEIMQNAAKLIKQIVKKTEKKSGTAIFVQSYALVQTLSKYLGHQLQQIQVFYDGNIQNQTQLTVKKGAKSENKNAFQKYYQKIKQQKKPAILVSVMGGKLSQGINFSDQLARSIIILGLPYPNIKSPQISQKMRFLDQKFNNFVQNPQPFGSSNCISFIPAKLSPCSAHPPETGKLFYESLCTKAVNQTIGRGLRHAGDYANIYLIDSRYEGWTERLAAWMRGRVSIVEYWQCQ